MNHASSGYVQVKVKKEALNLTLDVIWMYAE